MKKFLSTAVKRMTDKRVLIPVAVTALTAAALAVVFSKTTVDVDVFIEDNEE